LGICSVHGAQRVNESMKQFVYPLFLLIACTQFSLGQPLQCKVTRHEFSVQVDENTDVRDSTGKRLSFPEVLKMIASTKYSLDPVRDPYGQIKYYRIRGAKADDEGKREVVMRTPGFENFPKPKVGDYVPPFSVYAMDSSIISSEKLKGKILVFTFWFSLCKPCLYEFPAINQMAASFKNDTDVVFIAPTWESTETVRRFMEMQPFVYIPCAEAASLIDAMKVVAYPTHVIVGRDGKILNSYAGGLPGIEDILRRDIKSAIHRTVDEPSSVASHY
jgi:thiol-disulfide isomerase/thioredoxin